LIPRGHQTWRTRRNHQVSSGRDHDRDSPFKTGIRFHNENRGSILRSKSRIDFRTKIDQRFFRNGFTATCGGQVTLTPIRFCSTGRGEGRQTPSARGSIVLYCYPSISDRHTPIPSRGLSPIRARCGPGLPLPGLDHRIVIRKCRTVIKKPLFPGRFLRRKPAPGSLRQYRTVPAVFVPRDRASLNAPGSAEDRPVKAPRIRVLSIRPTGVRPALRSAPVSCLNVAFSGRGNGRIRAIGG
jgi:hypothetical protein